MKKYIKPGRKYFLINLDEPYAEEIYEVLKRGQIAKGEWPEGDISFEKWIEQTWCEHDWISLGIESGGQRHFCKKCGELRFS